MSEVAHQPVPEYCVHCGEPIPASDGDTAFCCHGCATAYAILHDLDLQDYYRVRDGLGVRGTPVKPSGFSFIELDERVYQVEHGTAHPDKTLTVQVHADGLSCAACAWAMEQVARRQQGVVDAAVDFAARSLKIRFDPSVAKLSEVAHALDRLGYVLGPYTQDRREEQRRKEDHQLWIRLGVAAAAFLNIMIFQIPHHLAPWQNLDGRFGQLFLYLNVMIALPVITYAAWPFHHAAWRALRNRSLHIDLPISLALLVAFAGSVYHTFFAAGDTYFDSVAGLVFFLLVGRAVVRIGQRRAERASETALDLGGRTARIQRGDTFVEVPVDTIRVGDRVEVLPDSLVPVDGQIQSGCSYLDESLLTGEANPVRRESGASVTAGSRNLNERLVVQASAIGANRRIARVIDQARIEAERKGDLAQWADRFSGYFTAANLLLSLSTYLVWYVIDPANALNNALAVAVVLCPCALGLATPLAYTMARAAAARRGAIVKHAGVLESLSETTLVAFDKTGTLTMGRPGILEVRGLQTIDGKPLLAYAAALEQQSRHPLARAFDSSLDPKLQLAVQYSEETPGYGIRGQVAGISLALRKPLPSDTLPWAPPALPGATPVVVEVNERPVACVQIADQLRQETVEVISQLRDLGVTSAIVTGDSRDSGLAVATELDIPYLFAGLDPEHKRLTLQNFRKLGFTTTMVGDGLNDTGSFAQADASIAMGSGAESALAVADIVTHRHGIESVRDLILLSRRMTRTLWRNLGISAVYNLTGAGFAVAGLIGPLEAAILMPISSLTVVVSSLWLDGAPWKSLRS